MQIPEKRFVSVRYLFLLLVAFTGSGFADPINKVVPPGVLFELLALNKDLPTPKKPKYNSPCAMVSSHDGKLLYIAQQTAKRIDVWSVEAKVVVQQIHLPDEVTGLAVSSDNGELYATCTSDRWPAGKTCVINLETGRVASIITTGWGSCAPVVHPDGTRLFVCNRFSNDVSIVNLTALREQKRVAVTREPCCAALTPDGSTLVVGNALSDDRSTDSSGESNGWSFATSSMVSLIDANNGTLLKNIRLSWGSSSVQDVAVSADGRYAFVTHVIGKTKLITSTVAGGHVVTNNLSVIDLEKSEYVNTVCLDLPTLGMGNPWGVDCSDDGTMIIVSHAGCNHLSVIQYQPFIDTILARTAAGIDLQHNFTTIVDSRERVSVEVNNPRDVVIVDNTVFTAGYFSNDLVQLEIPDIKVASSWAITYTHLGEVVPQTAERKGNQLFYDASLCFQTWLSCHSCHPNTRPDGFNWVLGGGAVTSPKNTSGLLHSWWTPPTTWTGRRGSASESIKAAIQLELFQASEEEFAIPLDTFCMNLKPVQSPYRIKGRLSEAALRGKELFFSEEANCAACHSGPLFTDCKGHETTVTDPFDAQTEYFTPSLVEAWRTKPYGHIGSMASVHEMIDTFMDQYASRELTSTEIDEITEYVLSL